MEWSDLGKTRWVYNKKGSGLWWYHPFYQDPCSGKDLDHKKLRQWKRRELVMDQLEFPG